jgi:hypothetical protein
MSAIEGEPVSGARPADPWLAAEWFVSPDTESRRQGLDALTRTDRLLFSPLVMHLLVSRLDEPDLELRCRIVVRLARCLQPPEPDTAAGRAAREHLAGLLRRFNRMQVEWLLEADAGLAEPGRYRLVQRPALALLDRLPNVAGTLTRIAADGAVAMPTRAAAVAALGELGVIEALPALEGLKTRLEGQAAGQMPMAFAPGSGPAEEELIGPLKAAIDLLLENE